MVVAGFDRPNLHLAARFCADVATRTEAVTCWVAQRHGSGLVYEATRKDAETYAAELEIGRAGRDGAAAEVMLFHRAEDRALHRFLTGGRPDRGAVRQVAAAVRTTDGTVVHAEPDRLVVLFDDVGYKTLSLGGGAGQRSAGTCPVSLVRRQWRARPSPAPARLSPAAGRQLGAAGN